MHCTLEATCWLRLGCWSNNVANSHLSPGSFNSILLRSSLVQQCSYPPNWPCYQRRLVICDSIPAPYASGQSSYPRRHPTYWTSSQWSHTVSNTLSYGALTYAPLSAHLSIEWKCTASQIETPISYTRCSTTHQFIWRQNWKWVECRQVGVHYETPYFPPWPTFLEWHCREQRAVAQPEWGRRSWPLPKQTCWDFHWSFTPIFNCSEINGRNNRTFIRWLTHPEQKFLAAQLWVQINRLRTGVGRFWPLLRFASVTQQIKPLTMLSSNVQSINLPMDCPAWRFSMMRQSIGCSTPALRSSAAKKWTKRTGSNDDEEACACVL